MYKRKLEKGNLDEKIKRKRNRERKGKRGRYIRK